MLVHTTAENWERLCKDTEFNITMVCRTPNHQIPLTLHLNQNLADYPQLDAFNKHQSKQT